MELWFRIWVYELIIGIWCAQRKMPVFSSFFLVALASAILIHALITSDFSIIYVWEHSSTDMPLTYKFSSFWGGMNGSLLFWILVQSFFAMIVAYRYQYSNREIIPYVIATFNAIMAFLLLLLIGWSNPLELQTVIPEEGRGLNPLLQNPAMAIHPPSLYLGFIGFSVPFCLCNGGTDPWKNGQRMGTDNTSLDIDGLVFFVSQD